ncbi:MAG: SUMF1/EgtB/PvdO family nonheme iron enzyme [Planctomycetota bacterium]
MEAQPPADRADLIGAQFSTANGVYRVLDRLGAGGMGVVYLAEQTAPVKRRVALKLIKLGMDSKEVLARFAQERQALALMEHDGIARIYDCGVSDRGQPYFVMELVKGVPIVEFCERHRLSLPRRLELMQDVCDAVQHAHQKGVVHRDLKPGNVLVSEQGGNVQPKVIDFGLAKAMGPRLVEATLYTEVGRIVGTPEYMAPEQANLTHADVDTRADIYSLGVLLYEVLVGALPFSRRELEAHGPLEMVRMLTEDDPPRPSARLAAQRESATALAAARRTSVGALQRALRTDLDWVVMRALEKDPSRRYQSVSAIASDLQRFLDHEPLEAGPPSASYRIAKVLRRYRLQVLAAGAVLITAVVGGVLATHYALAAADFADRLVAPASIVQADLAIDRAPELLPPWPERLPDLDAWLANARELVDRRGAFAAKGAALRAGAGDEAGDEVQREQRMTIDRLLPRLDSLALVVPEMERERRWASTIAAASQRHRRARHTWDHVRATLAAADGATVSAAYRGQTFELRDEDVVGLVPIGVNPRTKLWEFYDLRSAWDGARDPADLPIPQHRDGGEIDVGADTGIVFVLVPGGTYWMGAQSAHPEGRNFDPSTAEDEFEPHQVTLDPFLIARHELTRGQWRRLTTVLDVATHDAGNLDARGNWRLPDHEKLAARDAAREEHRLPMADVSWAEAAECMRRHSMCLPTEAQWECACRANTTTSWWTGAAVEGLLAIANVEGGRPAPGCVTPVGSQPANAFGLHDVHGNVMEWCRDLYCSYDIAARRGDGLRTPASNSEANRILRGGSFGNVPEVARSAFRLYTFPPSTKDAGVGLRPARALRRARQSR